MALPHRSQKSAGMIVYAIIMYRDFSVGM